MKVVLRFSCKSAGYFGLLFIFGNCASQRQEAKTDWTAYPLSVENLRIRDPFILVDRQDKSYFLHANSNSHFRAYKSKDLIH